MDEDTEEEVRLQGSLGTLLSTVYVTLNKHPTNKYQPLTTLSEPANDPSVSPDVNSDKSGVITPNNINNHQRLSDLDTVRTT